jgi:iduronate 2-sulfatase
MAGNTIKYITVKNFKLILGAYILLFFVACSSSTPRKEEVKKKPNILFISVDDLGPNLGCYDNSLVVSPHMDAFAAKSMVFRETYCQAAVCAPSRASLMTGLRPDSSGVWHLGDKFREIMPDIVTMPQYFHKFGYYTVNMGKIFHNYMPDSVSWDEPDLRPSRFNLPEMRLRDGETFYHSLEIQERQKKKRDSLVQLRPNYYADGWNNGPAWEWPDVHDTMLYDGAQTDYAIRTLTRISKMDKPFYFALGYFRPHLPFVVPKKYWDLYDKDSIPLASNSYLPEKSPLLSMNSMYELRGYDGFHHIKHPSVFSMNEDTARILKAGYYASISYVDAQIGRVLEHLKDLGIDDNTIVVIWGDHGWKLGEHNGWCKQTNYNIDTHVPMIVYSPFHEGGKQTFALTELIDMFPTLCELSGVEIPNYNQGLSMVPLLENPDKTWKTAAFSQFHRRPRISPDGKRYMGYSMKTSQYHYVEWYHWDNKLKVKGELAATELYDNLVDPDENVNIAGNEEMKEIISDLSQQLKMGWRSARPVQ